MEKLSIYVETLRHWQQTTNLIAPDTLPEIWHRHIADCAQLIRLAPHARTWVDLGSGAGLPGMILAILQGTQLGVHTYLIESNKKKAAFLSDVKRRTGAPVEIVSHRIESPQARSRIASGKSVDIVTARALAPLGDLLAYAEPIMVSGAVGLFMKGRDVDTELRDAQSRWQFEYLCHASVSDHGGAIVEVRSLKSLQGRTSV
ncbi:MAG: 16S rRNA (guanine(527)-N(7))-methyltransferase RsmG [Hyphomicrobiaceae bacterium]